MAYRIAGLILGVPILVSPWLLGGVKESTHLYIAIAIALSCVIWMIGLANQRRLPQRLTPALVPLLLGLLLGLIQLCPLPGEYIALLSPHTAALWQQLTAEPESQGQQVVNAKTSVVSSPAGPHRFSLRPAETRHQIAMLVLAISVFWLAGQLFQSRRSIEVALIAVTVNGGLLAILGIMQSLSWNGRLFWIGRRMDGGAPFATFINRNNAAGYLNLCLAAALAMAVWQIRKVTHSSGQRPSFVPREKTSAIVPSRIQRRRARWTHDSEPIQPASIAVLFAAVLILAGILGSLSRGGTVAAVVSLLIAAPVVATNRVSARPTLFIGAIVVSIGLLSWLGRLEVVSERLASLSDRNAVMSDGRLPNWRDAAKSIPDFWTVGSGLGSYPDIYRVYQTRYDETWYRHAENQFLQATVEGGIGALCLLLAEIVILSRCAWKLIRDGQRFHFALGVGAIVCLVGQVVSGSFDFGLYHPAQMMLMAAMLGIVAQVAAVSPGRRRRRDHRRRYKGDEKPHPFRHQPAESQTGKQPVAFVKHGLTDSASTSRVNQTTSRSQQINWPTYATMVVMGGVLIVGLPWSVVHMHQKRVTASLLDEAKFRETPGEVTEKQLEPLIGRLSEQTERTPNNAMLQYYLAKSYEYLYRVRMLQRLRTKADAGQSIDALWQMTSLGELHRRIHRVGATDGATPLDKVRHSPLVQATLGPAVRHLQAARGASPILPQIHLRLARLAWLTGPRNREVQHLARIEQLAPGNAAMWLEIGELHLQADRLAEASKSWQQAIRLTDRALPLVLAASEDAKLPPAQVVNEILPPSVELLVRLATHDKHDNTIWKPLLLDRAEDLLKVEISPEKQASERSPPQGLEAARRRGQKHFLLGQVYLMRGNRQAAYRQVAQAVKLYSREVQWRRIFAELLLENGEYDEARRHARWCALRDSKNRQRYRALLLEIGKRRLTPALETPSSMTTPDWNNDEMRSLRVPPRIRKTTRTHAMA